MAPPKRSSGHEKRLQGVKIEQAQGLENDPEIRAALGEDTTYTDELDTLEDAEKIGEEALEDISDPELKAHPFANGTTIPFPYEGFDTEEYGTCSPSRKDANRGCRFAKRGNKPACPFVGKGPVNLVYKDLRSGRVKMCPCTHAMNEYLNQKHIVFIPLDWVPTRHAEFKPLPNGLQPTPGPGQPRTPIVLSPRKTSVVCTPDPEDVKTFQQMRRRGDFEKPMRVGRRRRAS